MHLQGNCKMPTATLPCCTFRGFTTHSFFPPPSHLSATASASEGSWKEDECAAGARSSAGRVRVLAAWWGQACACCRAQRAPLKVGTQVPRSCPFSEMHLQVRHHSLWSKVVSVCVRVCACACGVCVYTCFCMWAGAQYLIDSVSL